MIKGKDIGNKIQAVITWFTDMVEPIENRWFTLGVAVFAVLVTKAAGAHGLSNMIALIYIMFWVTNNHRPRS